MEMIKRRNNYGQMHHIVNLMPKKTQKATRQIWTNVAKEPNELPQILKPRRTV